MKRNPLRVICYSLLIMVATGNLIHADQGGVKVGIHFSSVTHAADIAFPVMPIKANHTQGLAAGFFYRFTLPMGFSIQPELLYIEKGFQQTIQGIEATASKSFRFRYIEIPLLLRFKINSTLYVAAGPYFARRLSTRLRYPNQNTNLEGIKKNDNGWAVAGGFLLDDDAGAFIEVKFEEGRPGIFPLPDGMPHKNYGLTLSFGYGG